LILKPKSKPVNLGLTGFSFYGFPGHYYKEKYPNVGSKEVAQKVLDSLKDAGIAAEGVKRGLDHGVWASFKCGTWRPLSNNGNRILTGTTQPLSQKPTP
jgi:hypothetical protein